MADERITETSTEPHTTIIERRGGGGLLIGVAVLILVVIAAWFLINRADSENRRNDAVTSAAKSVGDTADKAGDAIDNAVR